MDDEVPKHRSKKNTKRWCKGRVGIPHTPRWERRNKWAESLSSVFVCQQCRKELDYWFDLPWRNGQKNVPPEVGSTEPLKRNK